MHPDAIGPSPGPCVLTARGDIRLLLADVDGTLLTRDKVLTDDAKAAVRDLRRAGIVLAITSGRPRAACAR